MPFDSPVHSEFFGTSPTLGSERRGLSARRIDHTLNVGLQARGAGPARRDEQAHLIDAWLQDAYRGIQAPPSGIALVAHGSLGRRDLGPVSRIDIAVLWDDTARHLSSVHAPEDGLYDPQTIAGQLWHALWETGTSFAHATYSLAQCSLMASVDLADAIPLLDLRFIAGDPAVAEAARSAIQESWRTALETRPAEIQALSLDRGRPYPALAHSSEPNLILDRGGLRDATLIRAVTTYLPADSSFSPHPQHAPRLRAATTLLRDVRDALQVVRGSGTGRLLVRDQQAVAGLLGILDADTLMRELADAGRTIAWELRRILRVARTLHGDQVLANLPRDATWLPPSARLTVRHGALDSLDPGPGDLGTLDALAALRFSAELGIDPSPELLVRLRASGHGLTQPLTAPERDMLVGMLAGEHLADVCEALEVYRVIDAWCPAWNERRASPRGAEGQRFTPDWHLVQTVAHAASVARDRNLARPDLLLIAALVHTLDPAGAEAVARALGFEEEDALTVALVVRHHRILPEYAFARDTMEAATVARIAEACRFEHDTLDLLVALTEAEARASAPSAHSPWRAETLAFLARSVHAFIDARRPSGSRASGAPGEPDAGALAAMGGVHAPLARLALDGVRTTGLASVVIAPEAAADGARNLIVAMPDRGHSLLTLAHMAAQFGIELVSGQLEVNNRVAFSSWWVRPRGDGLPHPSVMREYLGARLGLAPARAPRAARRTGPSPEPSRAAGPEAHVRVVAREGGTGLQVLHVNADNRPRLVGDIAQAVASFPVVLHRAHVRRLDSRVLCSLYVSDRRGAPVTPGMVQRLTAAVERAASLR